MASTRIRLSDQIANWSTPEGIAKATAIHLPGLPNSPMPIPGITEFLIGLGYEVLQPHYPGTYDSAGAFNPYNSFECVSFWANGLRDGTIEKLANLQNLEANRTVALLSCHSFGSYTGMKALRNGFEVEKAIFFGTSFCYGPEGERFGIRGDKTEHSRFVERAFPKTFGVSEDGIIEEFFMRHSHDSLAGFAKRTSTDCVAVVPNADPTIDPAASKVGVTSFFDDHPTAILLHDFLVADKAGHAVASMLTDDVKRRLTDWF
ncbi:MAG: hypothetical protein AAFU78_21745 [Cyanobacteria bacterium J06633_2]